MPFDWQQFGFELARIVSRPPPPKYVYNVTYAAPAPGSPEDSMRLRPKTQVEMNAAGQSTPASQAVFARSLGGWPLARGGGTRRRKKNGGARARVRVRKRARSRGKAAHLVAGSAAAKRHMARLRRMQRRK